jgi:acyl-CoA hydrolase
MKSLILCLCLFLVSGCEQPEKAKVDLNLHHTTSFVVFPQDCNANPPMLFGGKILAEMDRCAGITVRRLLYASPTGAKDAVTVSINNVKFHKAGEVKDLIFITGKVVKTGNSSITLEVIVERELPDKREVLVTGEVVFVSFDLQTKKAIPHGIVLP